MLHSLATGTAGPRVAFLHGLFGQGRNWMQIAKGVAGPEGLDARCLLLDLPNHGRSPWLEEFAFEAYAEAVASTLRLAGERWTVVGHSLGGKTAMVLALRHPELVERLCVVDIAPRDYGNLHRFSGYVAEMQRLPLGELRSRADAEARFDEADPGVKAFLLQNLRREGDRWFWQTNLDLVARDIARGSGSLMGGWPVVAGEYPPFEGPVLWLAGGESAYVAEQDRPMMRALFPKVRMVTVKGAGHWVHTDAPALVTEALRRFLAHPR